MNASKAKSLVSKKIVGRHSAGNGLYLRVTKEGAGYWVVRYSIYGKRREITIGNFKELTLAQANLEAAKIKLDVSEGIDPLTERKREDNHNIELVIRLTIGLKSAINASSIHKSPGRFTGTIFSLPLAKYR